MPADHVGDEIGDQVIPDPAKKSVARHLILMESHQ